MLARILLPIIFLIIGSISVSAASLFEGAEDVNFTAGSGCGTSCAVSTDPSTFRSTLARSALWIKFTTAAQDPPDVRWISPNFTPAADLWFHAQFCHGGTGALCATDNATVNNTQMLRFIDNLGNATLIVRGTGTDNQVKISSRTSGGAFTDLVTCSNAFNAILAQLDIHVVYGAVGSVTLYKNDVSICTFAGDTRNGDGATTIQAVELSSPNAAAQQGMGFWSEVIVADEDTRSMNLFTMYPISAGFATQWTGATPCSSIINNNPFNDLSFMSATANNLIEECLVYQTLPLGTFTVKDVAISMRGLKGFTGPQTFDFMTRFSGTDFLSSDQPLLYSMSNVGPYIQITNPGTGSPWTTLDLANPGLQFGIKSRP